MPCQVPAQSLPDVRVAGKLETCRKDAGDLVLVVVQPDQLADDSPIAVEARLPETMADQHDALAGVQDAFRETGPENRAHAEHRREVPADLDRVDTHRPRRVVVKGDLGTPPGSRVAERLAQRAIVHEVHRRHRLVIEPALTVHLPERDEAVGSGVRQRIEHDTAHEAEDRSGRTHTDGEGQDSRHQEARRSKQRPDAVPDIPQQIGHRHVPPP